MVVVVVNSPSASRGRRAKRAKAKRSRSGAAGQSIAKKRWLDQTGEARGIFPRLQTRGGVFPRHHQKAKATRSPGFPFRLRAREIGGKEKRKQKKEARGADLPEGSGREGGLVLLLLLLEKQVRAGQRRAGAKQRPVCLLCAKRGGFSKRAPAASCPPPC